MSRPRSSMPAYQRHISGQAVVRLANVDFYLGDYDSPESRSRYFALLAEYNGLAGSAEALDARLEAGRGFAPLSWLEQVGNDMTIKDNIRAITERGREETDYYTAKKFDITIDDITLDQTVEFLHKMESAPQAIRITECRLKPDRKDRNKIDVRMEIAVLAPTGEA